MVNYAFILRTRLELQMAVIYLRKEQIYSVFYKYFAGHLSCMISIVGN